MGVFVGVTGKRSYGKATIPLFFYRGGGIRTPDLSVPNRALYQAEPRPGRLAIIHARLLSSNRSKFAPFVESQHIIDPESRLARPVAVGRVADRQQHYRNVPIRDIEF